MYKKINILIIISTIILITSCATTGGITQKEELPANENKVEKITSKPKNKSITKNEEYLTTNINYPEFEGKPLLNKIIENSILSYYNEFEKASKTDWEDLRLKSEDSADFPPFFYGTEYTYLSDKRYTSVLIQTEIFSGGAHGNISLNSYNYSESEKNLNLSITESTGYSYEELSVLCRQTLYKKYPSNKDWIDSGTEPYPHNFEIFLVNEKKVVIYFEPYSVGPYSEGIQAVELKLKK